MQDRAEHLAIEQPAPSISWTCSAKKVPYSVPGGTA
jgi:hypothetical protein